MNLMRKYVLTLSLFMITFSGFNQAKYIRILLPENATMLNKKAAEVLGKQITARCPAEIVYDGKSDLTIELVLSLKNSPEAFAISKINDDHFRIAGGNDAGILYGVGKFLRTSRYGIDGFTPGTWQGTSYPVGKMRGMYLATHFNNFYEAAPIEKVQEYIEDLALWGINSLVIHFPNWQYTGFSDVEAREALTRCRQIFGAAKSCGMKVGLLQVPNQGFKYTNAAYLNVPVPDSLQRRGHFGINLNPANPGANKLLKENWAALLDEFRDIELDLVVYWPYDEGGCGCDQCWPWGARGYPKLSAELTEITRQKYPRINTVLSTWMYDTPPDGEWAGLKNFLKKDGKWLDYILADSHEDFPAYPLEKGVPGDLPLLNFPEISMWGQNPWGGYGANPMTGRLQRLWNQTDGKLRGGFPYSEGIYEDLNKIICTQLYWDTKKPTHETVKEYIAYEFSPDVVEEVFKALKILEANHLRDEIKENAIEAHQLMQKAEKRLTPQVRNSWRWRILYLRAVIDREMYVRGGKLSGETLKSAFNELTRIYHAENSHSMPVHPPVIE